MKPLPNTSLNARIFVRSAFSGRRSTEFICLLADLGNGPKCTLLGFAASLSNEQWRMVYPDEKRMVRKSGVGSVHEFAAILQRRDSSSSGAFSSSRSVRSSRFVLQIAHPIIGHHLLQYIYHGFLVPVLGPSIHQVRSVWLRVMTTVDQLKACPSLLQHMHTHTRVSPWPKTILVVSRDDFLLSLRIFTKYHWNFLIYNTFR